MKKFMISSLFLFVMLVMVNGAFAQSKPGDEILGTWLNEDKDAHIEVFQQGGKYFGKIIWLKTPLDEVTGQPKLDTKNSNVSLRTRPVMGMILLKDFEYDGDGEWDNGEIYDPKNGKTYDCYMEFESKDKLKIRGYIGISLIGRSTYWTRVR